MCSGTGLAGGTLMMRAAGAYEYRPPLSGGFTLIELMVVIVILGILAGLIVPRIMGRPDEAKQMKAKIQIESLETAIKLYKLDSGQYPTTEQGLQALVEAPAGEARQPTNPNLDLIETAPSLIPATTQPPGFDRCQRGSHIGGLTGAQPGCCAERGPGSFAPIARPGSRGPFGL